jgi:glycogen debranching enzyme
MHEAGPSGEWLLANGLGGYAMGAIDGPPTRGYHGFLVAATRPPDGRMLLVGQVETWLEVDGIGVRLDAYQGTADDPEPETPPAESSFPGGTLSVRWVDVRGAALELRSWMIRDANATVQRWRRLDGDGARRVRLDLTPLVACRDHHPGGRDEPAAPSTAIAADPWPAVEVRWAPGLPVLRIAGSAGTVRAADRLVPVHHSEDAARGTAPDQVLRAVASFGADLEPGGELTLVLSTGAGTIAAIPAPVPAADGLGATLDRADDLVARAGAPAADTVGAGLVLAADRFVVRRRTDPTVEPAADPGRTVIAGYPWFGDWGRDTMISLPGLAIATGRLDEAAGILRTWAGLVRDGLLPNLFPGAEGGEPAYHSVDAPLWFIHALGEHEAATGDPGLALEVRPSVEEIITAYRDGTRFGVGIDPADGLVRAGEGDVQPTWMDAKVDGVPITPRHGKPVEIQALWVNALRRAARWATLAEADADAAAHDAAAARAESSFRSRFWRADVGWLADVVDGPAGDDIALRPNQLLALSLPHPLVDNATARSVLDAVERHLVVPGALRSLAPFEPGYRRSFQGPPAVRDAAYHQGTAWTWLLGPWIDAVARFRGQDAARAAIEVALEALDPAGGGAIPELLEPEPPHEARGCPWQAWGVAELLRVRRRWSA